MAPEQVGRSSGRVRLRPNRGFPRGLARQCNPSQFSLGLLSGASNSVAHQPDGHAGFFLDAPVS
jgi:hypothetical protein